MMSPDYKGRNRFTGKMQKKKKKKKKKDNNRTYFSTEMK
jgi:hypothetical protein